MKKIRMFGMVLAVAIVASGCSSMCNQNGGGGTKCSACGKTNTMNCPHCGMPMGQCKCPTMAKPMAEINTAALKALINSNVALTLVDARTGKFDDGRRIQNALNLGPDAKDEDIASALKSKDALIVSYCANLKCPASRMLAAKLITLGYTHVLEYPQGIEGWVGEGNPVTQVSK